MCYITTDTDGILLIGAIEKHAKKMTQVIDFFTGVVIFSPTAYARLILSDYRRKAVLDMHGAQRKYEEWMGGRVATKVVFIYVVYMLTLTHGLCDDASIIVHRGTSAASEMSVDNIACRA
jgi:hypothetical protein